MFYKIATFAVMIRFMYHRKIHGISLYYFDMDENFYKNKKFVKDLEYYIDNRKNIYFKPNLKLEKMASDIGDKNIDEYFFEKHYKKILLCDEITNEDLFILFDYEIKDKNQKLLNFFIEKYEKNKEESFKFIVKMINYNFLDLILLHYSNDEVMLKHIFKCFDDNLFDMLISNISIIYIDHYYETKHFFNFFNNLKNINIINFMKNNNYFERYKNNIYLENDCIKIIEKENL
jgi:hypothetical protein